MTGKPNLLLITSDQQHWITLGLRNPEIRTPNLDRLARRGILFNRAYCPNPTCTPTRASIITGLMPSRHGAYSLGTRLPEDVPTLGDALQRGGYRTSLIGKAHFQQNRSTPEYPSLEADPIVHDLDFWRTFHGPFYGFDHIELARNHGDEGLVGQHYAIWMEENGLANWRDYFQPPAGTAGHQRWRWALPERYHLNAWIAERTNTRLEEHHRAGEPFFLWASFFDPHPPYLVPEPWDTLYRDAPLTIPRGQQGEHDRNPPFFKMTQQPDADYSAWQEPDGNGIHGFHPHLVSEEVRRRCVEVYYGMVTMMDKYIGTILDRLDALGLTESTLVVFTTDHGHLFGQHDLTSKGPFHYEDLLRIPFIAARPGTLPEARATDDLVSLVDLMPTFLEATGIAIPAGLDGCSHWKNWRGLGSAPRDHVLVENRHQPHTLHLLTRVDRRHKITVYKNRDYGELFDLESDPGEFHNLWNEPAAQALKADLLARLDRRSLTNDPPPMPRVAMA
jgi:arylsulfatase A-like enzyme